MKLIRNRKGEGEWKMIMGAIVAVVILLIIFNIIKSPVDTGGKLTADKIMEIKIKACMSQSKDIYGNLRPDYDNDGLTDCCDPCPVIANNDIIHFPDNDNDGFPQGCYGNDGNLTYDLNGKLDAGKYNTHMLDKYKDKIETEANDKNPNKKPVYKPSC
jgi:hypothetical protein